MSFKATIDAIEKSLPGEKWTRFAPSPTGHLHIGHIASAIYIWGIAKQVNAKIILRIEDHDKQRSKPENEKHILQELEWLGFEADLGCHSSQVNSKSLYRQKEHDDRYQKQLNLLKEKKLVYGCTCTRKEILAQTTEHQGSELWYPGFCRNKHLDLNEKDTGIRIKIEKEAHSFDDLRLGKISQTPYEQCGDFLIKDRHKNWTYHFASTIDDIEQNINLVIRGEDIISSTGRQIYLRKKLKAPDTILFMHHPLLYEKHSSVKLSKRFLSQSITDKKNQGFTPGQILGEAAYLIGLIKNKKALSVGDLASLFD